MPIAGHNLYQLALSRFEGSRNTDPKKAGDSTLLATVKLIKGDPYAVAWKYAATKLKALEARPLIKGDDDEEKRNLPCVTFAGTFSKRKEDGLLKPSGLITLDYDNLEKHGTTVEKLRQKLIDECPYAFVIYRTPSHNGLKVLCYSDWITDAATYTQAWQIADKLVSEIAGFESDQGTKDVARLAYLAHDPKAVLKTNGEPIPNEMPERFVEDEPKLKPAKPTFRRTSSVADDNWQPDTIQEMFVYLTKAGRADAPYDEWRNIVWAAKAWGDETGNSAIAYDLARAWSATGTRTTNGKKPKPVFSPNAFDSLWHGDRGKAGGIGVGTLIKEAKDAGWKPQTIDYSVGGGIEAKTIAEMRSKLRPDAPAKPKPTPAKPKPKSVQQPADLKDDDEPKSAPLAHIAASAVHPETGEPYDIWNPPFDTNGVLNDIKLLATSLYVAPIAFLGMVFAESAASVAHNWLLPPRMLPFKFDEMEPSPLGAAKGTGLCLFSMIVAPPGSGKSQSYSKASQLFQFAKHTSETTSVISGYKGKGNRDTSKKNDTYEPIQHRGSPSSGEGMLEAMIEHLPQGGDDDDKERGQARHRMRPHWDEAETLYAVSGRENNPLMPLIRSAFSCEDLKTEPAEKGRIRFIKGLSYSFGVSVIAQEETAGELLSRTGTGDSQRWLVFPATTLENEADYAEAKVRLEAGTLQPITISHWELPQRSRQDGEHATIKVAEVVSKQIAEIAKRTLHQLEIDDTLTAEQKRIGADKNSHNTLNRLRMATHVSLWCGDEPLVTYEHWVWAGAVLSIAENVRNYLIALDEQEVRRQKAAEAAAVRADRLADGGLKVEVFTDAVDGAAQEVLTHLRKATEPVSDAAARSQVSSAYIATASIIGMNVADFWEVVSDELRKRGAQATDEGWKISG